MSDHYTDTRNTIYRQQKEAQRKMLKSQLSKISDDDLQLVEEVFNNLKMFRNFFLSIKRIAKMDI